MRLAETDKRFREAPHSFDIFVERNGTEREYAVYVGGDADMPEHDRMFPWGDFDDGYVHPNRARADARNYARWLENHLTQKKRQ